jgi:hypothetical protein
MIKMGFKNVKNVDGGGEALEKYFEHYKSGKIINPITGKVTVVPKLEKP